jgi:PAS domain S-box-containing protein
MAQASSLSRWLFRASTSRWSVPAAWVFALALYVAVVEGGLARGEAVVWITDLAWTAAALLATHACLQAARALRDSYLRRAWSLFAAAFGCWLVGQLIWDWNEPVRGIAVPFPSASDFFYTVFGFVAIAALLALREPGATPRLTARNFGNLGLIVCTLAVAATTALLEPIAQSQRSAAYLSIALTEALSIVAGFIVSVYSLWSYRWGAQTSPLVMIVLGFAVHATVVLAYIQALIVSDFGASHHLNIGWLMAFGFQHCAAREQVRIARGGSALPADTMVRERRIEALLPGLLLLSLVIAAAAFHRQLTPRVLAIDAALLALFAIILVIRESWMYARERRLKALLESSNAQIDLARDKLEATRAELAETERALRLAASAGNVGIFEWDLRTEDVQYSVDWKRQLGYEDHEIGNGLEEWRSRVHPDDAERALAAVKEFLETPRKDFQVETRLRHRDGSYRWMLTQLSLRSDANGEPMSILGTNVDITRQKNNEAALRESEARYRELAAQLERRVAERTAQLEDAYHELESFAYAVSHDLKAPLRAIDGFSQLLVESAEQKLNQTERDHIARVRRGAIRMAALIDGLLAYSRVERRELLISDIHLSELLDEALAEHDQELAQRRVAIVRDVPPAILRVDREALMIVLRNLLENALKFTRNTPEPRIELGAHIEHGRVTIRIADNGIGFEQTYHDQIFSIFQRLHFNGEYEGTGIGLALARKAVQRMNGRLWAESAVGQGATFYVELPLDGSG